MAATAACWVEGGGGMSAIGDILGILAAILLGAGLAILALDMAGDLIVSLGWLGGILMLASCGLNMLAALYFPHKRKSESP